MDQTAQGGRYRRVRSLGRGAMGEVWLAEDSVLHRQVALKTVASYGPPDPTDLDRIMREARLAARLNHPNAVAVYDVFVENGQPCVVMEYASGMSLAERITESGRLPAAEVGRIGMAVGDALAEAHRLGIVHRDVKPANILITERGVPKLADFGIARGLDSATTVTGLAIGTPAYLAPEVARGASADTRSDVWSLGVTLYAAVEGRSPFVQPGDDPLTVISRLAMTPQVAPPLHGETVTRSVMSAMAVDPAARPSAEALVGMLSADLSGLDQTNRWVLPTAAPVSAPPRTGQSAPGRSSEWTVPLQSPPRRHRRSGAWVAGLAAVVLLAGAGTVGWLLLHSNDSTPSADHSNSTSRSSPGSTSSSPSRTKFPGVTYAGPGGVHVTAPNGWIANHSNGPNVVNYVRPGDTTDSGTYFHIGIGHNQSLPSIQGEARGAVHFLRKYFSRLQTQVTYIDFQGTAAAVDVEYVGTSPTHIRRHGVERLWIKDGVTRIIELTTTAASWPQWHPLFGQLVDSARVS